MPKILEVIVTSADEAVEAQMGGADRLELARSLEDGGLTPAPEVVRDVLRAVSIPVRVMLRESASMATQDAAETDLLKDRARRFGELPVDGFVLGFAKNGSVDLDTTEEVLASAPHCPVTFHRAFEHAADPLNAIARLKRLPQVDRLLTRGCPGTVHERRLRLVRWQEAAGPTIKILVGVGTSAEFLAAIKEEQALSEVHAGRAARIPQTYSGAISRDRIAALKSALQ